MEYSSIQESIRFRNLLETLSVGNYITKDTKEQLLLQDEEYMRPKTAHLAWIGINPSGETMLTLASLASKIPYKDYMYCVEQNTDNGIRPHLHILAKVLDTTRPNKEIERLSKLFKTQKNFIEFKISTNRALNNTRKNYIKGEKIDLKKENVEKDIKDRIKYNLQNYYLIGNI